MPLLLLFARVFQGEDIPHPIPRHISTALILVLSGNNLWFTFPSNANELVIPFIFGACIPCLPLIISIMWSWLTFMDRSSTVLELFIIQFIWNYQTSILLVPCKTIHIQMWIHYLPGNYIFILFFVESKSQGGSDLVYQPFKLFLPLNNRHGFWRY